MGTATITIQSTNNETIVKFVSTKPLINRGSYEYGNIDEAKNSPLAQQLFYLPFVKKIFISQNYVSITKYDVVEWSDIHSELRSFIRTFLQDGKVIIEKFPEQNEKKSTERIEISQNLEGTSAKIVDILDEYIRPAVASDGGNIAFKSYDENSKVVSVILQGACSGCPSSTATLKNGIEMMLKEMLPHQVSEVIAING